jgi:hypothetical protein
MNYYALIAIKWIAGSISLFLPAIIVILVNSTDSYLASPVPVIAFWISVAQAAILPQSLLLTSPATRSRWFGYAVGLWLLLFFQLFLILAAGLRRLH